MDEQTRKMKQWNNITISVEDLFETITRTMIGIKTKNILITSRYCKLTKKKIHKMRSKLK